MGACQSTTTSNHSPDLVQVFCGREKPVTLCGYHASEPNIKDSLKSVK